MERTFLRAIVFAVLGVLLATDSLQQVAANGPAVDDSWVWHTAQRLRSVVAERTATDDDVLAAAEAELALGDHKRARALLARLPADSLQPYRASTLGLLGMLRIREEDHGGAALFFSQAAERSVGVTRGVWHARAGDSFERVGLVDEARAQYGAARRALPTIDGWIAIRQARVIDDAPRALALLDQVPIEARRLAFLARGTVLLAARDSLAAMRAVAEGGDDTTAARVAFAVGEMTAARRYAYSALHSHDTAVARVGLAIVSEWFDAATIDERLIVARALRRLGRHGEAAQAVASAIDAGDTSAATRLLLGEILEATRRRAEALEAYVRAAEGGGGAAEVARYRAARLLVRMGRRSQGYTALLAFAEEFPDRAEASLAAYLVAEARERAGQRQQADSLFRAIAERWPTDTYGGRARLHLASLALRRGDTANADRWYQAELATGGALRTAAQFFAASLRAAAGDSTSARALWTDLAQADSLGYYGAAARAALGMPALRIAAAKPLSRSLGVRVALQRLDLLRAAFPAGEEVTEFVQGLVSGGERPVPESLDLAEGLIERGFVTQGIRIGWQAARRHTLHDPRVLRVVYPWPFRELIEAEGKEFNIDAYLLAALIRQESGFRPDATSRAGAKGLMQLMPATAAQVARRLDVSWDVGLLNVADANLHLGAAHLAALLRRYAGNPVTTLAAYNAGGTPVSRWLRSSEASGQHLFVEHIPYVETRNYVKIVLRNLAIYRALYSGGTAESPGAP
jgi:soluble lytic murein transglycosylase